MPKHSMTLRLVANLLAIAGIADSAYLLHPAFLRCYANVCLYNPLPFPSELPALGGLLWFVAALVVFNVKIPLTLKGIWQLLGIAGIAALIVISIVYSYFCPYCYAAHTIGAALILISMREI